MLNTPSGVCLGNTYVLQCEPEHTQVKENNEQGRITTQRLVKHVFRKGHSHLDTFRDLSRHHNT